MVTSPSCLGGGQADAIRAAALQCASLGLPVIAIHGVKGDGSCTCGDQHKGQENLIGKHPWGKGSPEATLDPKLINMWFDYKKGCNYGIVTGREFNHAGKALVVIDIDSYKEGGLDALDALEALHGKLPDTATVLSGGNGVHRYYLTKIGQKFRAKLGADSNIDIKGPGGYVIGPKSVHRSGRCYETEASSDLFDYAPIADLPSWVTEKFGKCEVSTDSSHQVVAKNLTPEEINIYQNDLSQIPAIDRSVWRSVLMALKDRSDSEEMFQLADKWSQSCPEKYFPDDVRYTWNTIKQDGGITIKTLHYLANEERAKKVDLSSILLQPTTSVQKNAGWLPPISLQSSELGDPYPFDALPALIQDAAQEVQQFTKTPMPMVVCSALAALSLSAQSLYDVQRAELLTGPIGLFIMVIADSGERKTTLDNFFSESVRNFEARALAESKPKVVEFKASHAAWEAKKKGLLDRISLGVKSSKDTNKSESDLQLLEAERPVPPQIVRLVYSDVTIEKLTHALANDWPSAGVLSSEGGTIFGGHAMGKDSQMRTMANYNELWDGKGIRVDRRTSESYSARGVRLTAAIQVQEPTLSTFLESSGSLARGTGFLARFLIAWPTSTQGSRFFTEAPKYWPSLTLFHKRIADILEMPQPMVDGELQPTLLTLSPFAKESWVNFHDEIEEKLAPDGDFSSVRDVASKTADNAVRLAALFHVLEGATGPISQEHMLGAARIAKWHLSESSRFLDGVTLTSEQKNAAKLDSWILNKCTQEIKTDISTQKIAQFGPSSLRQKATMDAALAILEAAHRIRSVDGKKKVYQINPLLLSKT
ncbi:DUF3987 domain-containing protein [Undibacterium sp. JH2W]|uniref:DUF3987 domain-containing protein n=1 Tax=Undibacterium sp. JH2W TaxID=3413037 RepID=UPI003BF45157